MRKNFFILCLCLGLAAALTGASAETPQPKIQTLPAKPPALELQRDYIDGQLQPRTKGIVFPGTPCAPCWGEVVSYTTFSSPKQTYDVRRYDGHEVTLLIPVTHPRQAAVTERRLRTLVDRLDILYASYRSLLGWEPTRTTDPRGKQIFAVLPNEPADWYGLAFVPGDNSEYSNAVLAEADLDHDVLGNVWVHELAHNFDPIRFWDHGADAAHDWTTLLQTWYARQQMHMDNEGRNTWSAFQEDSLESGWRRYLANPALDWLQCVATSPLPQACADGGASLLTGKLGVVLGQQVDGRLMRDWLRLGIAGMRAGTSLADDPGVRSDHALNLLATATRSDTRCIAVPFRWRAGAGLDPAGAWGTPFPGCVDGDGDGASRFIDCDDTRAAVKPGAAEIADGRDNDCDGMVDERLLLESAQASGDFSDNLWSPPAVATEPLRIVGALSSTTDKDSFGLTNPVQPVRVTLCATGGSVELVGVTTGSVAWSPLARADDGRCSSASHPAHVWRSFLVQGRSGSPPASYTLDIRREQETFWPRARAIRLLTHADGIRAEVDATRIPAGDGVVRVRWLVSGGGFIQDLPLSDPASLRAPAIPAALRANPRYPVQLRAQLWREEMPIEEPSYPFTVNLPSYALASGVAKVLPLGAGQQHPRLFIDVPVGATSLRVTAASSVDVDLFLSPIPAPAAPWADANIAAAPDTATAPFRATTAGNGNETLLVNGAALTAGRWYVVPRNAAAASGDVTVTATVTGTAPVVRRGSYYNADRSGHGVFLYPAGNQWAGIWYTYLRDTTPTWYYLQGPAPGANGIWNGTLYRSKWTGTGNVLTEIGNVLVTPTAADKFTWSFNLDGEAGSEPMLSLGRGCPQLGGAAVDSSGNWFDPAHAGTGHSAQFWSGNGYQFFASFIYDGNNDPRYVVSEKDAIGTAQQVLPLEQLAGFCPLCARKATPVRRTIGELARTFENGRLNEILLSADYTAGVPGSWDSRDVVQTLGEFTQGCTP